MPAGDKQAATLRALLTGKFDLHKEMLRDIVTDDEKRGYLDLVMAAFIKMVGITFDNEDDVTAAVVEWVGKIRSESDFAAEAFDPVLCEKVILFMLDKTEGEGLTGRQLRDTELLLLPALVHDQGLNEDEIEQLLSTSLKLANDDRD